MPEGDTIHRIAARLAPRLTGKTLERVTTQGLVRDLAGRVVRSVAAHGKHLVIELDGGVHLRAHLGMNGRFRMFDRAEGEARLAAMSPGRASLALTTDDGVYLWIGAPTIEVSHRRDPRHGMAVAALGPDILADDFDPADAARRAGERGGRTIGPHSHSGALLRPGKPGYAIGEALLDQRIAAGIGNIYKNEALFAAGVDPRTPVAALDAATLTAIYAAARAQMLANLGPAPRTTRAALTGAPSDARYFVYSRTGKPCIRCATPITCIAQGDDSPRWTWWCPTCQPPVA